MGYAVLSVIQCGWYLFCHTRKEWKNKGEQNDLAILILVMRVVFWLIFHCRRWFAEWSRAHFLNQSEMKPVLVVSWTQTFSRAWWLFHSIVSSRDWCFLQHVNDIFFKTLSETKISLYSETAKLAQWPLRFPGVVWFITPSGFVHV